MKVLVVGAGVLGSYYAAQLAEHGVEVELLARGRRLAALREHGLLLAEGNGPVRRVEVPVVERADGSHQLALVLVHAQQAVEALRQLRGTDTLVVTMLNWAGDPAGLSAALGPDGQGRERLLLGFPTAGGIVDGDVVRYTAPKAVQRLMALPVGEPDGSDSARVREVVALLRGAGCHAAVEHDMTGWLRTHAAFVAPLGLAAGRAGGPRQLAARPGAVQALVRELRGHLAALPHGPVPRSFVLLQRMPESLLVWGLRRFLVTPTAELGLATTAPAAFAELELLDAQLRDRA